MRQGAQGLGEMKSSTQVRECVRQEEGHLPTKGEKGGHSWAGAQKRDPGSHDVSEPVNWEWGK